MGVNHDRDISAAQDYLRFSRIRQFDKPTEKPLTLNRVSAPSNEAIYPPASNSHSITLPVVSQLDSAHLQERSQ